MRLPSLLLSLAAAGPAVAQSAAPPPGAAPTATAAPSSPVIVNGRRTPPRKEVEHLTRAITVVDPDEHVARFPSEVCPLIDGMPADYAARLAARIRADAAAAAIPVGKEGCRPNVIVMFVPSGRDMVREMRRRRPYMFGGLEPAELNRLAADPGPAHGWTATELRSRDDDRLREGTTKQDVPEIEVRQASIIELATRSVITASVLLIDQDAAVGKTVNQLADYAAMRTLAKVRAKGATGDTILTLFDARPTDAPPAPRGLTGFDAGYLKALYHGPATSRASSKVGQIAREIDRR